MKIDFSKMYVDDDIRSSVIEVLNSGRYIRGDRLRRFEEEFADFCGTRYSIGVSSGTSAILLALTALGIKKGDEVIVPAQTFVATASPVLFLGGTPVFADISEDTYTIDPMEVERRITKRTKAVIPVHLYGHPCDMDPINDIARDKGLAVIEDACQSHGAAYKGKRTGSIGDLGCFSFFPSKNMTVLGEGGMVSTNDDELAEKVSMLRDHGRKDKYIHEILGLNLRMDEIHAAIGRESLKHVSDWNRRRREVAAQYNRLLEGLDLVVPVEKSWAEHVYHLYVIRVKGRDELAKRLNERGISTGVHYPVPLHRQPCMFTEVSLPVTERCVEEILSLPMHPQLSHEEIEYVCNEINEAL